MIIQITTRPSQGRDGSDAGDQPGRWTNSPEPVNGAIIMNSGRHGWPTSHRTGQR